MKLATKRSIPLAIALIMVLSLALAGCNQNSINNNILEVGIDNTYPPMEFKDENGDNVGFDIEFANEIGKRLDMKVEFKPTAWSGIFLGLDSGKYDCIISSLSITEERQEKYYLTKPYISNTQVIVVKSDNADIKSADNLQDKIVGVQLGTTSEEACGEFTKKTPFKDFKKYEGMTEALMALKSGKIEAVVTDLVIGKYFVAKDKSSYNLVEAGLPSEPIGIGLKKTSDELGKKIEGVIDEMIRDGSLKAISEKWFGEDMTSNIK